MKEMEYKKHNGEINFEILDKGQEKGIYWWIVSYGSHPCAYLAIKKRHEFFGKDTIDINLPVHGGITYSKSDYHFNPICLGDDFWIIGWDYAHYRDYSTIFNNNQDKKWTIEEIKKEVMLAIEELEKVED